MKQIIFLNQNKNVNDIFKGGIGSGGAREGAGRKPGDNIKDRIKQRYGIDDKDFEGVTIISGNPPGFKLTDGGRAFVSGKGKAEYVFAGYYYPKSGKMYVAPGSGDSVVLHELGHHVTMRNGLDKSEFNKSADRIVKEFKISNKEMSQYGLRPYSFTHRDEFLADSYLVHKRGTQEQRNKLFDFAEKRGLDFTEAYGWKK